jgi:hypothetical protein
MEAHLSLNIPDPFLKPWMSVLGLGEAILNIPRPTDESWVILALARKAARSTYAAASLASLYLWGDALVIGRTLFEAELTVEWLLAGEGRQHIRAYLQEIAEEQDRLLRKSNAGRSVSAQILGEMRSGEPTPRAKREKKPNIRDKARKLDMERLYDLEYWMASAFAHSHALSLSEWHEELHQTDQQVAAMFSLRPADLPCWSVLTGLPTSAIRTFRRVDLALSLGFAECIEGTGQAFRDAVSAATNGAVKFDPSIPKGDLFLGGSPNDPLAKRYSPNRN